MKKILLAITFILFAFGCNAQISFNKFKFIKDSPFGGFPGRKATDTKFTITSEKEVKYVRILYVGVNQVGDAVSGQVVGAVNAGKAPLKNRYLDLTGPFLPGDSYSRWASGTFTYPTKLTAFPLRVDIKFRDGSEDVIEITEANLKTYFPCLKWMQVNLEDGI